MRIRACAFLLAMTLAGCDAGLAPGGPIADVWPEVRERADSLVAIGAWSEAEQEVRASATVVREPFAPAWQTIEREQLARELAWARSQRRTLQDSLAQAMRAWRAARVASQHDSMSVAEAEAARAYAVRIALYGREHPSTARAALGSADVAFRLSRIGRADTLANEARTVLEREDPFSPDLALAYEQTGRNLKNYAGGVARRQALEAYQRALQVRVRALGPLAPLASSTHHEIGNLERLSGHPVAALQAFRLSLEARRRMRGPVHDEVASTLAAMTILEATLGHWRSADTLATAMLAATPPNGTPPMSRAFRSGVAGQVLRHNGQLAQATRLLEEAVALNESAWELSPRDEGAVVQSGMSLHAELALAYVMNDRPLEALGILERGTSRALRERLGARDHLEGSPLLARLQRALRPDEALVSWVRSRFGTLGADDPAWAVVVRDSGPPRWVRLPHSTTPGPRTIGLYWNELTTAASWPVRVPDGAAVRGLARAAGEAWFTPLEPALSGVRRVFVCSPDLCAGGPPAALADRDGRWLGDRLTFVQAPSLALFARTRERSRPWPRSGPVVAIGDPFYPQDVTEPWARLAGSAEELEAVRGAFPGARLVSGTEARAMTVRNLAASGELSRVSMLHLAGHTVIDLTRPLESLLVLAPDRAGERDSRLSAREISEDWRLDADLVCLTGCRGGGGLASAMQGTLGFQYAFQRAGARSVLVSLWPVDDAAAARLVREFYLRLGSPGEAGTRAEALAAAQRALREWQDPAGRRPYAHPAYWAGFALIGDPD